MGEKTIAQPFSKRSIDVTDRSRGEMPAVTELSEHGAASGFGEAGLHNWRAPPGGAAMGWQQARCLFLVPKVSKVDPIPASTKQPVRVGAPAAAHPE